MHGAAGGNGNGKQDLSRLVGEGGNPQRAASGGGAAITVRPESATGRLGHGSVVIAAITSCTNTSNPSVMLAVGLLARKAAERGLHPPEYVKTSLAPGSRVVTDYLERAGLLDPW